MKNKSMLIKRRTLNPWKNKMFVDLENLHHFACQRHLTYHDVLCLKGELATVAYIVVLFVAPTVGLYKDLYHLS